MEGDTYANTTEQTNRKEYGRRERRHDAVGEKGWREREGKRAKKTLSRSLMSAKIYMMCFRTTHMTSETRDTWFLLPGIALTSLCARLKTMCHVVYTHT